MNRRGFLQLVGVGLPALSTTTYFDMGKNLWRLPELSWKWYGANAVYATYEAHLELHKRYVMERSFKQFLDYIDTRSGYCQNLEAHIAAHDRVIGWE